MEQTKGERTSKWITLQTQTQTEVAATTEKKQQKDKQD